MDEHNEHLLEWHTPEYIHTEKTSDWYWIVMIVSISLALIAFILNNPIFGILIIVSSFTLSLFAARRPKDIPITIDKEGVQVDKVFYPYSYIESFWIETRYAHPKIILKLKKMLFPFVGILIYDMDPEPIRAYLLEHLPEVEHNEPFLEKLLVRLGF